MKHELIGLVPMLEALGIEQTVSFDECYALLGELFAVTRRCITGACTGPATAGQ